MVAGRPTGDTEPGAGRNGRTAGGGPDRGAGVFTAAGPEPLRQLCAGGPFDVLEYAPDLSVGWPDSLAAALAPARTAGLGVALRLPRTVGPQLHLAAGRRGMTTPEYTLRRLLTEPGVQTVLTAPRDRHELEQHVQWVNRPPLDLG